MIDTGVLQAVQPEIRHSAEHRLKALLDQEVFQMMIAQRRIFHIDLADDADSDLLLLMTRNGRKTTDDIPVKFLAGAVIIAAKLILELADQLIDQTVSIPGAALIGLDLISQPHHRVAIKESIEQLLAQRQSQRHGVFFLQTREVDRKHRNMRPSFHGQRLAQQEDIVAGAAAAARLGDGQRYFVQVILSALQRRDHLADDEQGRITSIVMYVAEAFLHHFISFIVQHFDMVAARLKDGGKQPEMDGEHARHKDRMGLLHLRGEHSVVHAISSFRSSTAAFSERRRIFTAPRLSISSILIWV